MCQLPPNKSHINEWLAAFPEVTDAEFAENEME